MNKKTIAIDKNQYQLIITTIQQGFKTADYMFKPNKRLATILVLQANLGLRLSDILRLHICDIIRDAGRYRLDIVEQKTGKSRTFTVVTELYNYMLQYATDNGINSRAKLFDISERAVQKQLKIVCDYLGLENISTHSFRKFYATEIYKNNGYDVALVQHLLQHSTAAVTQRYIGIESAKVEQAINKHICIM
jgi:integrase